MTFFNPLSGSLVPATPTQRATDKGRQIARSQALRKNTAAEGDRVEVEHQVESAEELPPVGEDDAGGGKNPQQKPRRQPPKPDEEEGPPHLDVTG
jgi:hypothetical protein